jgi:putative salt-induced outer membrane protein YdiY
MRVLSLAIVAGLACAAEADRVYLDNGDRLSGMLVSLAEGQFVLESDYAGALNVPQERVLAVETEAPVAVRFREGAVVSGVLAVDAEGRQTLRTDDDTLAVSWADVAALARDASALEPPAEAAPAEEEPKRWSGAVEAGASWRSGETNTTDAHASLELAREWEKHTVSLNIATAYGEVESEVNTRRAAGELKWKYFPRERLYVFAVGAGEHDPGRRLNLRASGGLGVGYDVWTRESRKLSLDAGFDYTKEWWERYSLAEERRAREQAREAVLDQIESVLRLIRNDPNPFRRENVERLTGLIEDYEESRYKNPVTEEDNVSLRFGLSYEQKLFADTTLTDDLVVLPSVDEWGEFRANNVLALATPLSESLNMRVSLNSQYDSDPGSGGTEWDNALITSLRYAF